MSGFLPFVLHAYVLRHMLIRLFFGALVVDWKLVKEGGGVLSFIGVRDFSLTVDSDFSEALGAL